MKLLKIIKPDDWHVHFREGKVLEKLVPETSKIYNRSIVMPNLTNPIFNQESAIKYKNLILKNSCNNKSFQPLMTIYLNEKISKKEIVNGYSKNIFFCRKIISLWSNNKFIKRC